MNIDTSFAARLPLGTLATITEGTFQGMVGEVTQHNYADGIVTIYFDSECERQFHHSVVIPAC